ARTPASVIRHVSPPRYDLHNTGDDEAVVPVRKRRSQPADFRGRWSCAAPVASSGTAELSQPDRNAAAAPARPDVRTAGVDIRHARKETYRCGCSAQNPGGNNGVATEPTPRLDSVRGGCASGAGGV